MTKEIRRNWNRVFTGVLLLVLAACGSGGSGGGGGGGPTFTIGGALTGLADTLVLWNNGGDDLSLSSNGSFTFDTKLASGAAYNVTVKIQPDGQYCTVANGTGTAAANVTSVTVTCSSSVSVGGTVTGLTGGTLVLQNNGTNNLSLTADGAFTFTDLVPVGDDYLVTVLTQPTDQICTVNPATDSGTADAPVTNVAVNCVAAFVTIGGNLSGLAGGAQVVLQNNGGDNLTLTSSGAFTFPATLLNSGSGAPYNVTVQTQPAGQICTVSPGTGSGTASANVTNVSVNCVDAYSIGGTVSGLTPGTSLILQNNGTADELTIQTTDLNYPQFVFSELVAASATNNYNVTVKTHPTNQLCTITNGSGNATANVSDVSVSCVTAYSIGGTASGLGGAGLVLKYIRNSNPTDFDTLEVSGSGNVLFTFNTPLETGKTYTVSVESSPAGQTCVVRGGGSGTITTGNVINVDIGCPPVAPVVSLSYAPKQIKLAWSGANGAETYNVTKNPDGASGYTAIPGASNLTGTGYNDTVPVHLVDWINVSYIVEACNDGGCNDSSPVGPASLLTSASATGYVKASNTAVGDWFGFAIAVSGDGNTVAVGAPLEDSNFSGVQNTSTSTPEQANNGAAEAGAVYVYHFDGTAWSQQAYVKASNIEAGDSFGWSVALSEDGSTLAVGAFQEDGGGSAGVNGVDGNPADNSALGSGAAYVFTRSGSTWTQQAYVKPFTAQTDNLRRYGFGNAVTLSGDGDTLAVGATGESSAASGVHATADGSETFSCATGSISNCAAQSGAVYVYKRTGSSWARQAYVKASDTSAQANFGSALALSRDDGNTLAVGAYAETSCGSGACGAAYVFTRNVDTWTQQSKVTASNPDQIDNFGGTVALSSDGNTLAVGADGEDSPDSCTSTCVGLLQTNDTVTASSAGAVYVFTRSITTWTQDAYVKSPTALVSHYFGGAVALSGDGNSLVVGSRGENGTAFGVHGIYLPGQGGVDSGAAYLFTRSGVTWSYNYYIKASNTGTGDNFGFALGLSANGEALAIGANKEDGSSAGISGVSNNNATDSGAAYLY